MSSQAAASLIAAALANGGHRLKETGKMTFTGTTGEDSLQLCTGQAQAQPAFHWPDITAPILTTEEKQELAHRLTRFIGIVLKLKTLTQAVRLWNWADHQPEGPGAYDEIMVAMNPQWNRG